MDLKKSKCVPCRGDSPRLGREEIGKYLLQIDDGWGLQIGPDRIVRDFEFKDFKDALEFVNAIGELAKDEGHHPNIRLYDYKFVEVEMYTHKIAGLHKNDFILASKIDKI